MSNKGTVSETSWTVSKGQTFMSLESPEEKNEIATGKYLKK